MSCSDFLMLSVIMEWDRPHQQIVLFRLNQTLDHSSNWHIRLLLSNVINHHKSKLMLVWCIMIDYVDCFYTPNHKRPQSGHVIMRSEVGWFCRHILDKGGTSLHAWNSLPLSFTKNILIVVFFGYICARIVFHDLAP